MSAPDLLVVIDPVARAADGESVRIARDVLCAGSPRAKVCLPDHPEEAARALAKRGSRQPVLVGDDRALLWTVRLLYRERELGGCALSLVPVGPAARTVLARSLGVPGTAVGASRTVLCGAARARDLLVDDSGGVVLGALRVPVAAPRSGAAGPSAVLDPDGDWGSGWDADWVAGRDADGDADGESDAAGGPGASRVPPPASRGRSPLRGCRSLVRTLARPRGPSGQPVRLRVEADGMLLTDLDRPVAGVSLAPDGEGLAAVAVRHRAAEAPVRARARTVTVSGPDFRYRADALVGGPVRARTWTALPGAWHLTLPCAAPGG